MGRLCRHWAVTTLAQRGRFQSQLTGSRCGSILFSFGEKMCQMKLKQQHKNTESYFNNSKIKSSVLAVLLVSK